ncbi:zinc finger BED domain-containing protein RICESLEEPER 2-like [Pistacia vera]|uniref:zinc finger BED domain-containing protein RICESLEEPER 2-like n=1 Tax=Pistacia vera TaxID=55513 RepID=UPI0012635A30|nr:zinc finger BED domain-containing protein RICESLEEPER 2-like [Pistacia vera]
MLKIRELIAHWVLMHDHPFSIVEEEGLNNMMKYRIPQWIPISCNTCKNDCMRVFENERQKLLTILKGVRKISLTTDLWHSSNQRMEYMVLTGHWIDDNWKFNRRVLNFIHFPPPRSGVAIADAIFKCLMEWGIEAKVHTISVDNASSNDVAVKIRHIIEDIRDSMVYINSSESRLKVFAKIVQQRRVPFHKLILDCKARWNSTYDMLTMAMNFRRVFPCLKERDLSYHYCPKEEDWDKVEKICSILKVFSGASNLISGSDYLTSNLFQKQREAWENIDVVRDALYEVYREYVDTSKALTAACASTSTGDGVEVVGEGLGQQQRGWRIGMILKANSTKFSILSTMARDILAIPITTVASESAFNAGSRVIDTYRLSLSPDTVKMLLCGCDWCRTLNGMKKGCKEEQQPLEINLPIP